MPSFVYLGGGELVLLQHTYENQREKASDGDIDVHQAFRKIVFALDRFIIPSPSSPKFNAIFLVIFLRGPFERLDILQLMLSRLKGDN